MLWKTTADGPKAIIVTRHQAPSPQHGCYHRQGHGVIESVKSTFAKYIYYQILMHPADIEKTAVMTLFGLFKFNHLPFNSSRAGGRIGLCLGFLGAIIIASRTEAEVYHGCSLAT
jgi:hypothetical protein